MSVHSLVQSLQASPFDSLCAAWALGQLWSRLLYFIPFISVVGGRS